ncbi:hypothetical protein Bbelb_367100 [Branchiostoma belcheri]|nr:hypothetical protein Bbelb_367100 [Branchiostoma belcheri]
MSAEDDQMQVVHHAITGVTEIVSSAGSTDGTGTTGTAIYQQVDDTDRPVAVTQAAPGQPMEVVQIIPVSTEGSMGQMTVSGAVAQMIALNGGDGSQGQLYHVIPVSQSAVGQAQAPHMITVNQSAASQENTHEHTDPQDPTQSVEIIHDLTQATATLERLPDPQDPTQSVEIIHDLTQGTATLERLPDPQDPTQSVEIIHDLTQATATLERLPDPQDPTQSVEIIHDLTQATATLERLPGEGMATVSLEKLDPTQSVEIIHDLTQATATLERLPDPQDPTQSVEIIHDLTQATATLERLPGEGMATVSLEKLASDDVATITLVSPPPQQTLPDGCPPWAARLRGVEKIGDSFRGWVENDVELDLLLTYHKQQTQSFWGTRQSPTPGKPSTRLMWKSQYVPFDGIPFVNIGSRAIVQECQFGPRRKGIVAKKIAEQERSGKQGFKATCPARIYIKKVRKFPQFRVHLSQDMDRKALRQAQERAFRSLKESGLEHGGEERQYVQLPTPEAHQFHDVCYSTNYHGDRHLVQYVQLPTPEAHQFHDICYSTSYHDSTSSCLRPRLTRMSATAPVTMVTEFWSRQYVQLPTPEAHQFHDEVQDHVLADFSVCNMEAASRLHPRVSAKIRELVAAGMSEVYQVRKAVREFVEKELFELKFVEKELFKMKFVEKELFGGSDSVPERHNLSYFPTVNDIQNHVHLAQMAIERGELAVTAVTTTEVSAPDNSLEHAAQELQSQLWPTACHPAGCGEGDGPHTQTVTVTLTTNHGREHVVSQVETTMSDGTTLVSDSLTPETAQLLSALNPKIFQTQSEDEMGRKESETGASVHMEAAKGYDEELGQSQILIQDKISGQFCTNQTAHTIPLTVTNEDVGQALPSHFLTNSGTVTTEAANLLQTEESMPNMENQQQTNAQENP